MLSAPTPPDEPARLAALRETRLLDTEPEQAFDDFTRLAAYICDVPISLVSLVDAHRQWFKSRLGLPEARETPRDLAFCAHVVYAPAAVLVVEDAAADARFHDNPLVTSGPAVRFYAGAPIYAGGKPVGTLCVIDRVPRKLSEAQLLALEALARQVTTLIEMRARSRQLTFRNEQLVASEQRLVAAAAEQAEFLEDVTDMVEVTDPKGRFLYCNRAWHETLGYRPDDLKNLTGLDVVAPESRAGVKDVFRALFTHKRVGTQRLTLLGAGGRRVEVEATGHCHFEDGQPVALRFILRDVTLAAQADRLKEEFISTVSHELRTPLTSIRGALGLLDGGAFGPLPEAAREFTQIALQNAERLGRLVNDILDLEKLSAGRMELKQQVVLPQPLVTAALGVVLPLAQLAGIGLIARVESARPLRCDEDRLVQVLVNLVSNAVKFSPRGGEVVLAALDAGPKIRFEISDRGPGIGEADVQRLFRRFQQLDGSDQRKHGGTGLGLAISKAIVEQHGGTIGVVQRSGGGTTFWAELPAA